MHRQREKKKNPIDLLTPNPQLIFKICNENRNFAQWLFQVL